MALYQILDLTRKPSQHLSLLASIKLETARSTQPYFGPFSTPEKTLDISARIKFAADCSPQPGPEGTVPGS